MSDSLEKRLKNPAFQQFIDRLFDEDCQFVGIGGKLGVVSLDEKTYQEANHRPCSKLPETSDVCYGFKVEVADVSVAEWLASGGDIPAGSMRLLCEHRTESKFEFLVLLSHRFNTFTPIPDE